MKKRQYVKITIKLTPLGPGIEAMLVSLLLISQVFQTLFKSVLINQIEIANFSPHFCFSPHTFLRQIKLCWSRGLAKIRF